jgi:hypothetical protein
VFAYGRFECDTGTSYASVIAFGRITLVQPGEQRVWFFDELMKKCAPDIGGRPKSFYPRLHEIEVFALTAERLTGKETPLPAESQQRPALPDTHAGRRSASQLTSLALALTSAQRPVFAETDRKFDPATSVAAEQMT